MFRLVQKIVLKKVQRKQRRIKYFCPLFYRKICA